MELNFLKIRTLEKLSLVITLFVVVLLALSLLLIQYSYFFLVAILFVLFGPAYYFIYLLVNRYVIFRVKPIYQILTKRESSNAEIAELYDGKDVVSQLDNDIMVWAAQSEEEIKRLKIMERYRKEFIGNVSHELKTPIFSIQGYISTLIDGGVDDENIKYQYLSKCERNVDRLINIVSDLEEITKLESNAVELNKGKFDIVGLCEEVIEVHGFNQNERSIRVSVKNDFFTFCEVYANRSRIEQVLVNLISNSIKYGIEGGKTVISFFDLFDHILVEVKDNGIGIESADLPRVFERFYRVDKGRSRAIGGSGLGLSIVKHIIEAHNETITVRSVEGVGTTFCFTLRKG